MAGVIHVQGIPMYGTTRDSVQVGIGYDSNLSPREHFLIQNHHLNPVF